MQIQKTEAHVAGVACVRLVWEWQQLCLVATVEKIQSLTNSLCLVGVSLGLGKLVYFYEVFSKFSANRASEACPAKQRGSLVG